MLRRVDLLSTFMVLLLLTGGCYPSISGKVVEADSGRPVPGAVVVADWSSTHGLPGLSYRKTYKVVETQTDANGTFFLPGVYNPFVNPPDMIIFKDGYAPWANFADFEKGESYDEKKWNNAFTYRLVKWKPTDSEKKLRVFLESIAGASFEETPKYKKILRDHNL